MEIVSYLLKPIISKIGGMIGGSLYKKFFFKNKLNKISDFQAKYEGSSIDTNTFEKFLNERENSYLIFEYVFGAKYINQSKPEFIEHLSSIALRSINEFRRKSKLKELINEPALADYFEDLLNYLENIRDSNFKPNEMQMIANIQKSIIDANESLKQYFENNLYELEQKSIMKKYDDEFFKNLLVRKISDLGKRYNVGANVETKYNKIFYSIVSDELVCKEFVNTFENLRLLIRKLEKKLNLNNFDLETSFFDSYLQSLSNLNYDSVKFYTRENIEVILKLTDEFITKLDDLKFKVYNEENENKRSEAIQLINHIYKATGVIDENIKLYKPYLIEEPYLLFYGDGGIGKSHLLADNAKELERKGHTVLLFLGQHFNTREHPINQMLDFLGYDGSKDYFFTEMNNRAKMKNKKMVIFIDAMNEGEGKFFWRNYLLDFLNYLKGFEWISIIFSVRSNFLRSVLPENIESDFPLHMQRLKGFEDLTIDQLEPFFNYYKINPIIFPSLESECHNPLFLQIYCETVEENEIFKGWSILELLDRYVLKINNRLAIDSRFEFPSNINLVDKVLKALSHWFLKNKKQYIEEDEFYSILNVVCSNYTDGYRRLLLGLQEENLLTVSTGSQNKVLIYFTYERFSDIYVSLNILDEYRKNPQFIIEEIAKDSFYTGINESLIIVLAEKLNIELLDLLPKEQISFALAESFIRGISWRNIKSINSKTIEWMEICVSQKSVSLRALTYERLLKQSIVNDSPINSLLLNDILLKMDMPNRDFSWTIAVNNIDAPINLINHVINNTLSFQEFKKENVRLLSYTLIWLFSSTNNSIRDTSSNALSRIYLNNQDILLDNIKMFLKVDDPYIIERVLASAYGAITRLGEFDQAKDIIDIIYYEIFEKEEVYPNILVRDYARGIILYFAELGFIDIKSYNKVNPPYSSKWFLHSYTNADIDKVRDDIKKASEDSYTGFDYIVKSMTTEYGRGTGGYGDFGRYSFGSSVRDWKNQFVDQELSNIAVMRILEYGYDELLHGEFDINTSRYYSHVTKAERIGKKYQWISMYEMLARLCDNYPPYIEKKLYRPEYIQNKRNKIDYYLGKLKLTKSYTGIWDSFIRRYDPTLLIPPPIIPSKSFIPNLLPSTPSKQWAQSKIEFNILDNFIYVDFEGNHYISLSQLMIQKNDYEKFEDKDEFCIKTKAVMISKDNREEYKLNRLKKENNMGVSWSHSTGAYAFEHYWHPAFKTIYYNENQYDFLCEDAVWEYFWESNTDIHSFERETYTYLMPNYNIVNYFKLKQSSEGIWKDSKGNIIVFDAKYYGFENNLLINAEHMEKYLSTFNLELVWDCYMEKWSNRSRKEEWFICWRENGEITHSIIDEYSNDDVQDII